MAQVKRVFWLQTRALLRKNFHYQRKQVSDIIFNFVMPAVFLVLLRGLNQAFDTSDEIPTASEQMPNGGFAPMPFRSDACARNFYALSSGLCFREPFSPEYNIPIVDNTGGAAGEVSYVRCPPADSLDAIFAQCRNIAAGPNASRKDGLMGGFTLHPLEYPLFLDGSLTPNDNSSVPLHSLADYNETDPSLLALYGAESADPPYTDNGFGTRTIEFGSVADLDEEIFSSWRRTENVFPPYRGAFVFNGISGLDTDGPVNVEAVVYYNNSQSADCKSGRCEVGSGVHRLINALWQQVNPGKTAFAYLRSFPAVVSEGGVNFIGLVLTIIIGILLHFLMPPFMRLLTYERNSKIRVMMEMMGLRRTVYWLGTYLSLLIIFLVATAIIILVGGALRLDFFTLNTPISWLVLFFLWGNTMIAFVMFLVPFFQNSETALIFGWFYVVIVNFIGGPYLGQLYSSDTSTATFNAVSILPSFAFLRSIYYLGAFNSGGQGVTLGAATYGFDRLDMCGPQGPLCISYGFLIGQWAIFLVLGLYLDRVLPGAEGVREHPLFFLGFRRGGKATDEKEKVDDNEPEDVRAEREAATSGENLGIALQRLRKVFPGKVAVEGLSLAIPKGEVFGLLGHNGAGKTTTISMLTGLLDASGGSAALDGLDINTSMKEIYARMGVCPQFDVVWGDLTGAEHLYFYSRVKGFPKAEQKERVDAALEAVSLTEAAKRRVKAYSGGMRRRLSVAISLMGNPSVVFLDEPTTGLDPKNKHDLWDSLQAQKEGKTMILTTHSMEEAERLCDRVGIMAEGRLKCIGPPEEVKLRLGKGYRLKVSLPESNVEELHALVTETCPGAQVEASLAGSVVYQVPRSAVLSGIFATIEDNSARLQIRDWGISQSTLEDIFIELTQAEYSRESDSFEDDFTDEKA